MAQASEFRTGNLTPDQAERFAALFIPTWELPPDIGAGPDPGFKPAGAIDASLVSSLGAAPVAIPTAPTPGVAPAKPKATIMGLAPMVPAADVIAVATPEAPKPPAKTMMGIADVPHVVTPAPVVVPSEIVAVAPPAPAPPTPQLPSVMIEEPAPPPRIEVVKPAPLLAVEASDAYPALQKKRSPLLFVGIALGVVALVGVTVVATRSSDPVKPQPSAMPIIEKKLELPEPPPAAATPAEAKTAEKPAEKAVEKAIEKTVDKPATTTEPKAVAAPPPPAPKPAAPKAAAPPSAPKAAPAGGGKKPTAPKIKDEF